MVKEIYSGIKHLLINPWYDKKWETTDQGFNDDENNVWQISNDAELASAAYYLGQGLQNGDIHQLESKTAYIKFNDVDWKDLGGNVQSGILSFHIILIIATGYGDDRDITDEENIDQSNTLETIFKRLSGQRVHSEDQQFTLMESITRVKTVFPSKINNLIKSTTSFKARVTDYSSYQLEHNEIPPITFDIPVERC